MQTILQWIYNDKNSHPIRFFAELSAWLVSISCSLSMAATMPNPPLDIIYPLWISASATYACCAWSRKSFGMLANYSLLATIDVAGYLHLIYS